MYANRIDLVGTEKGLGVNLAGQITITEATSLDVNAISRPQATSTRTVHPTFMQTR